MTRRRKSYAGPYGLRSLPGLIQVVPMGMVPALRDGDIRMVRFVSQCRLKTLNVVPTKTSDQLHTFVYCAG